MTKAEYLEWITEFAEEAPDDREVEEGKAEVEEIREHDPVFGEILGRMMSSSIEAMAYARAKVSS